MKKVVWNLAKEDGWNRYKILTDEYSEAFKNAVEIEDTIEEKWRKFNKIQEKKKNIEGDKVTVKDKAKDIFEEEVKRANIEIEEIKKIKTSKAGMIWEIKKRIIGGKKASLETTSILNPETNKLAVSKNEIQRVTLNYCKNTLSNNEPERGFEDVMKAKKKYLDEKLTECDGDFDTDKETFDQLVKKFQRSRKPNYHFLVKASQSFMDTIFKFSKMMIKKEEFPECFQETTLHMIFKGGKGRKHILSDNRFVHSKFWFPRTVEGLVVVGGLKESLVGGSSI